MLEIISYNKAKIIYETIIFIALFSSDDGRDPVYTEDGEYESVTSSEDEKGNLLKNK